VVLLCPSTPRMHINRSAVAGPARGWQHEAVSPDDAAPPPVDPWAPPDRAAPGPERPAGQPSGYGPPPGDAPQYGPGTSPYGPPPGHTPPGQGAPQYGPPQYGPPQYGPPQYGPPQYGPPPGSPSYGPPPWGADQAWAPQRPSTWGPQQPGPWGQQPGQQWGQPGAPAWGWGPPPDPRAQRRKRLLALGALGGVVLLLLGVLGAAVAIGSRRDDRVRAEVARVVPGLQAFVEAERGLTFKEDVDVEVLGDDDFLDTLYSEDGAAHEGEEQLDPEPTLKALGLLPQDADLEEELTGALDDGVVGFYDPTTARLVVRGGQLDAFVEMTIVHELTHALQDQYFGLDRPEIDEADDERSIAFDALAEGDAIRVEEAWYAEQSPERQGEVDEYYGTGGGEASDVVDVLLGFPYVVGPTYVEDLVSEGGQAALDAAFADPPTTTEQILYGDRPDPVSVPEPELPGEVLDRGALGTLGLSLVLGEDVFAGDGTDLWDGDRYVTTKDGDRTCTLAHVAAADPVELQSRLAGWAQAQPDAEVGAGPGGTVRLRSCL